MNVSEITETLQVKNQHKIIEKSLPVPKRSILEMFSVDMYIFNIWLFGWIVNGPTYQRRIQLRIFGKDSYLL